MLRWMNGNTPKNRIQNEEIRLKIGVAHNDKKMMEIRLKWFAWFALFSAFPFCLFFSSLLFMLAILNLVNHIHWTNR